MKLELRNTRVRFGAIQALDGVDLDFSPGEVSVLVGPNGAGKSTLFGVLLGLVRPDRGELLADGVPVLSGSRRTRMQFRQRLGYLPESVAFSENLTGRQVMRFFARARGVAAARVDDVLSRVGLAGPSERPVRGYSRGMRQRLGLGIAILAQPELLILDEPTGGLDQEGLTLLWGLLEEWRAAQRVVIISTHDLALIERRADQIHVLSRGRVIASGTPDDLRKITQLPVQVSLQLGSVEQARRTAEVLGRNLGISVASSGLEVELSIARERLVPLIRAVDQPRADSLLDLRVREAGLDDVYQRLLDLY